MAMALPTGKRGSALALGLAALLALLIWATVVQPLRDWRAALTERVDSRRAVALRMEGLAQSLPLLRARAEAAAAGSPVARLLEGGTDALAGAALQARLRELAAAAQVSFSSSETLPAEDVSGLRRIGVRVSTTCDWPTLLRLLQELDQATPRMLVDDLRLQSTISLVGAVTRPLSVSMTILAYRAVAL